MWLGEGSLDPRSNVWRVSMVPPWLREANLTHWTSNVPTVIYLDNRWNIRRPAGGDWICGWCGWGLWWRFLKISHGAIVTDNRPYLLRTGYEPHDMYLVGKLSSRRSFWYIYMYILLLGAKICVCLSDVLACFGQAEQGWTVVVSLWLPSFLATDRIARWVSQWLLLHFWNPIHQNDPLDERIPTRYISGGWKWLGEKVGFCVSTLPVHTQRYVYKYEYLSDYLSVFETQYTKMIPLMRGFQQDTYLGGENDLVRKLVFV